MDTQTSMDDALTAAARDGFVGCRRAFEVASSCGAMPRDVGVRANELDLRIASCQLGLFGYAEFGEKTWIREPGAVPSLIESAIRGAANADGMVACAALWRIADELGLPRIVVGSCAEALSIRVRPCQLGCF